LETSGVCQRFFHVRLERDNAAKDHRGIWRRTSVVSEDYKKKMLQNAVGEFLSKVAAGEISAEDADIGKAQLKMIGIAADMIAADMGAGAWPWSPEERMRREAMLIAKWPEACRRAGVGAIPMPDHFMRAITSFVGRAS
jgi:hypothetical protein